MTRISRIALLALLTFGISACIIPAAVAQGCYSTSTPCPPDEPDEPDQPEPGDSDEPDEPVVPFDPDNPGNFSDKELRVDREIDCEIKDEQPVTSDFWIINTGDKELVANLKIRYLIPSTGKKGAFLLPRTLAAGQKGKVRGLIADLASGTECRVHILD